MNLDTNNYSISEIKEMLARNDLVVNRGYQRNSRLWPAAPRSYFIDTILNEFPFPKLYFYEFLDRDNRRTKREIVDGQQRVSAMMDFLEDKFPLIRVSEDLNGKRFSDLDEEAQESFLSHPVPVDVIRNAKKSEILEMFRRMNAYTLPLNDAEKRHSTFQGTFKWFINRLATYYADVFIEHGIFTNRQVVRMADSELLAEMILSIEKGIVNSSNKVLSDLYKQYDKDFREEEVYANTIEEAFDFIVNELAELRNTHLMKPYVIHSLFCALIHNKHGLPGIAEKIGLEPIGQSTRDLETAVQSLEALSGAHETRDTQGEFSEYVWSCSGGTNREPRRVVRVKYLCMALRSELL